MSKETGGPAFPVQSIYVEDQETNSNGMTLRDYFAAKALEVAIYQVKDYYGADKNVVALWCYDMADAMLEARK